MFCQAGIFIDGEDDPLLCSLDANKVADLLKAGEADRAGKIWSQGFQNGLAHHGEELGLCPLRCAEEDAPAGVPLHELGDKPGLADPASALEHGQHKPLLPELLIKSQQLSAPSLEWLLHVSSDLGVN